MKSPRSRTILAIATVLLCLAPWAAQAQVRTYFQDFEGMALADSFALSDDGWVVFGNVYDDLGGYLYGYGTFPAPNGTNAFCQLDTLQGGPDQGNVQFVAYSDYNNIDHANGYLIESNVFREVTIDSVAVNKTWAFSFQAKRGNIAGSSTANAFIKTLDPTSGYATTNLVTVDMTTMADTLWTGFTITLAVTPNLEGQLLQYGFSNTATLYEGSGIFYDNVLFEAPGISAVPGNRPAGIDLHQNYPNPFNPSTRIDFSLERAGAIELAIYDMAGRRVSTLQRGYLAAGDHHEVWNGKTDAGAPVASGRYNYVLRTAAGQTSRSMILLK